MFSLSRDGKSLLLDVYNHLPCHSSQQILKEKRKRRRKKNGEFLSYLALYTFEVFVSLFLSSPYHHEVIKTSLADTRITIMLLKSLHSECTNYPLLTLIKLINYYTWFPIYNKFTWINVRSLIF